MSPERQNLSIRARRNLQLDINRQVGRLLLLGFHNELGESEDQYRADFSLPEDATRPKGYGGRFKISLVVDPRVSLIRTCELAAGGNDLGLEPIEVSPPDYIDEIRNSTEFPSSRPYLVCTHDGQQYRPVSVGQAESKFQTYEVGSSLLEVVHDYLQFPEYFVDRGQDAAGSFTPGNSIIPWLARFNEKMTVSGCGKWDPNSYWGALSRSREIILLGPNK